MLDAELSNQITALRRFNRFYTQKIRAFDEGLLESPFSLAEARILYELAQQEMTATTLREKLGLDAGYLSRILKRFQKQALVERRRSELDRRQYYLVLTEAGKAAFAMLDTRSQQSAQALLLSLSRADRQRLVTAMNQVKQLLVLAPSPELPYLVRSHRPGDMGWVVHRHAVIYAEEYGWDEQFEELVASIVADFIKNYNPQKEHCWIAEREGDVVGSVFIVKQSDTVAKLRLLLVEPRARGLGIGSRLVEECIQFSRRAGYQKIVLWTNSVLHAARLIYLTNGFRLIEEESHHSFGHDLIGQVWELDL